MHGKRFLPRDLHSQIDPTAADQCGLARCKSIGAARDKKLSPSTEGEPIGGKHGLLGETKFNPRDSRQRRAICGPQAPFETHRYRCSMTAGQGKGSKPAAQGNDQRSVLRALTLSNGDQKPQHRQRQQSAGCNSPSECHAPHPHPYLENLKLQ
jgi:hypothetical protein